MALPPQLRKRNPSLSFAPVWSDHWWGWGGGEGGTEELGSGWAAEGASRCDGGALAQADTPAFESHLCPELPCGCSAGFLLGDPEGLVPCFRILWHWSWVGGFLCSGRGPGGFDSFS